VLARWVRAMRCSVRGVRDRARGQVSQLRLRFITLLLSFHLLTCSQPVAGDHSEDDGEDGSQEHDQRLDPERT
jgi:hypothetical protein